MTIQDETRERFGLTPLHPWRMAVVAILLNRTTGKAVRRVLPGFWERFQSPGDVVQASFLDVAEPIHHLGLSQRRATTLKLMSQEFLDGKPHTEWTGLGEYGLHNHRMFVLHDYTERPVDHTLIEVFLEENGPNRWRPR